MDHLIDDNDRLKPCPFCGGEATFDHDDNGWNWVECLACGASTNARVSAMDDCKPLLLEQWNKRVPPACGCREGDCESKPAGLPGAQPAPGVPACADIMDATRYRWLRENGLANEKRESRAVLPRGGKKASMAFRYWTTPEELDMTIDAMISAAPKPSTKEKENGQ